MLLDKGHGGGDDADGAGGSIRGSQEFHSVGLSLRNTLGSGSTLSLSSAVYVRPIVFERSVTYWCGRGLPPHRDRGSETQAVLCAVLMFRFWLEQGGHRP